MRFLLKLGGLDRGHIRMYIRRTTSRPKLSEPPVTSCLFFLASFLFSLLASVLASLFLLGTGSGLC